MIFIVMCLLIAAGSINLVMAYCSYEVKCKKTEEQTKKLKEMKKESEERLKEKE